MAFFPATFLVVLLASSAVPANAVANVFHQAQDDVLLRDIPANISTDVIFLSAPYYRKVSAAAAWVIPRSIFDLGARDTACECFDPSQTCCMAKSGNIAPFCIPKNFTCCSDAYCKADETCCGGACCPATTICNFKLAGSGCCPKGQICSSPSVCYDYSSSSCNGSSTPAQQCCPSHLPFCRDFQPEGLGCYNTSSLTAAKATVEFAMPAHPPPPVATPPFVAIPNITESGMPTTWSSTFTITATVTIVTSGSDTVSIAYPTATTVTEPPFPNVDTSTTFVYSSATPSPTSLASTSALCFNPSFQSAAPCSPSTSPSGSVTAGFAPPGALTVSSQGNALLPPSPFHLDQTQSCAVLATFAFLIAASGTFLLISEKERDAGTLIDKASIQVIPGSARKLRGQLGKEIQVVEGSARKLRGRLSREIRDVDGSGRILHGELGREIRVVEGSGRVLHGKLGREIRVVEGSAKMWKNGILVDPSKVMTFKDIGLIETSA